MFAMLKFREHSNAAAFSRAFVLTIKIVNSEENTAKQTYTENCKDEDSDPANSFTMLNERNFTSVLNISSTDSQKIGNTNGHLVQSTKETKLSKTPIGLSAQTNVFDKKQNTSTSIARNDINSVPTFPTSSDVPEKNMITLDKNTQRVDFQGNHMLSQNTKCPESETESLTFPKKRPDIPVNDEENSQEHVPMINDHRNIHINSKDDTNTDSTNLPYQYFIEEDIQKSHITSPGLCPLVAKLSKNDSQHNVLSEKFNEIDNHIDALHESNFTKCDISDMQCDSEHEESHLKQNSAEKPEIQGDISLKYYQNDRNKQRSIKECGKKTTSMNNILRSSDITDLVMEGLMFTIRQDQDSIKVVEQKTKFELDEVLENSEKAETKEGEKRLLNSSLLRLESLVTMLDPPEISEKRISKTEKLLNVGDSLRYTLFQSTHSYSNNVSKVHNKIDIPDNIDVKEKQENFRHFKVFTSSQHTLPNIADTMDFSMCEDTPVNSEDEKLKEAGKKEVQGSKVGQEKKEEVVGKEKQEDKMEQKLEEELVEEEGEGEEVKEEEVKKQEEREKVKKEEEGCEEEEEEEEEEDIIPEALQLSMFQPTKNYIEISEEEKNTCYQDLLMDDNEIENKTELDDSILKVNWKHSNMNNSYSAHNENDFVKTENRVTNKRSSNVPRVISNKIITLDQMPPALQNAIKNKLLKRQDNKNIALRHNKFVSNSYHKTGFENGSYECDDCKKSKDLQKATTTFAHHIDVNNTECVSNMNNAIVSSTEEATDNNNKCASFLEEKEEQREEMVTSSKLRDITKEFYKNLYQQQKTIVSDYQKIIPETKQLSIIENTEGDEIHLKMLKFIQDITRGVKVVVERMSTKDMPSKLRKVSI